MNAPVNAREFLASVIKVGVDEIPENPTPENFAEWDSLTHSEILMALEDLIGRELEAEEIASIDSLADIQAILAAHAGDN